MIGTKKTAVFPGRIIFDHLPKTAGTAVAHWLMDELGLGCVTSTLIGEHRDLIRQYGGLYSIISAHMHFARYPGLDARYQYITLLREPVDRTLSQLYFLLNNHDDSQIPELRAMVKQFIDSDGADIDNRLLNGNLFNDAFNAGTSNPYVEHFYSINGHNGMSDDEKIACALATIRQYDVVGLYENLPAFLADVSALLGVAVSQQFARINVTKQRPDIAQLSPALRNRIEDLNRLDIRFYAEVAAWQTTAVHADPHRPSRWQRYDALYDGVTDAAGRINAIAPPSALPGHRQATLHVEITNNSHQHWPGNGSLRPTLLSYHWLNALGEIYDYEGLRSLLPAGGIAAGQTLTTVMSIKTPPESGHYVLELTLLQECIAWFETIGFTPKRLAVEITPAS